VLTRAVHQQFLGLEQLLAPKKTLKMQPGRRKKIGLSASTQIARKTGERLSAFFLLVPIG
jgi:hypothetical protein